jgi:hypothetical protein
MGAMFYAKQELRRKKEGGAVKTIIGRDGLLD